MIELTKIVSELRQQLLVAVADAADADLQLELGPIELEITTVVTQEDGIEGKLHFWVIAAGGEIKDTLSSTQRIKLTLQPKVAGSRGKPWVSGGLEAGER